MDFGGFGDDFCSILSGFWVDLERFLYHVELILEGSRTTISTSQGPAACAERLNKEKLMNFEQI